MNAPIDLADYRRPAEPEPEPELWTLERHATDPDGSGVLAEIADRIMRIERRLQALERRGRL